MYCNNQFKKMCNDILIVKITTLYIRIPHIKESAIIL